MTTTFTARLAAEHPDPLPDELYAVRASVPDMRGLSSDALVGIEAIGVALAAAAEAEIEHRGGGR